MFLAVLLALTAFLVTVFLAAVVLAAVVLAVTVFFAGAFFGVEMTASVATLTAGALPGETGASVRKASTTTSWALWRSTRPCWRRVKATEAAGAGRRSAIRVTIGSKRSSSSEAVSSAFSMNASAWERRSPIWDPKDFAVSRRTSLPFLSARVAKPTTVCPASVSTERISVRSMFDSNMRAIVRTFANFCKH